jgi:hypothetical protein
MSPSKRAVPRHIRVVRTTLLLVGEGPTDAAFLKHLKSLYCKDGAGVKATIKRGHGGDPLSIIKKSVKYACEAEYDYRITLLDMDIPWSDQGMKLARKKRINLVGSNPCIEGLLLSILNEPVPESSQNCKVAIKKLLPSLNPLERESYVPHFSKEMLEKARTRISELDKLLKYLEGIRPQK